MLFLLQVAVMLYFGWFLLRAGFNRELRRARLEPVERARPVVRSRGVDRLVQVACFVLGGLFVAAGLFTAWVAVAERLAAR